MEHVNLLVQSLQFIEEHLCENIKISNIANACYCSKSTLEKMFQCMNGISVHNYIVRRRMMLAAREISEQSEVSILTVAVKYGYSSHEAFARAFKEVWNCNPSEFRDRRYTELFPKLREPIIEGGRCIMKNVDISQLYDLFIERKQCYFVCCDIKSLVPINNISRKAGDLAILEAMNRMDMEAGEEDMVFRIGGDEFCILTNHTDRGYAEALCDRIKAHNGEGFSYEDQQIPLNLYAVPAKFNGTHLKYDELFTELHMAIKDCK